MPIEITMPALSPTMESGKIISWLKKEGDTVSPGDVISEIETDKAIMELDLPFKGKIGKILTPAGTENVKVGTLIGVLLSANETAADIETFLKNYSTNAQQKDANTTTQKTEEKPQTAQETCQTEQKNCQKNERILASPLAKKVAEINNLNISQITSGSGPNGRIIKADVEAFLSSNLNTKQQNVIGRNHTLSYTKPITGMRKTIAKRLSESKQTIPHFYLKVDVIMDNLLETREIVNKKYLQNEKQKVSVNDMMIKIIASAIQKHPIINSSWSENGIIHYNNIDISFAVSVDEGLITPIVQNADQKTLFQISSDAKSLIKKAKEGKLSPQEYQGGSITISNMGMMQVKEFGAIINPPQSCIVAIGSTEKRIIVDKNDQLKVKNVCTITLSADHRVIDGSELANFANTIKDISENPLLMLF